MLTAGGRAPPFGDLAKCATAAGADVRAMIPVQIALHGDGSSRSLSDVSCSDCRP